MSSDSISLLLRHALKSRPEVCEGSSDNGDVARADNELMARVNKGDDEAFGQLFERYYVAVRSIARKVLRDPEDVADVIQESFLDVYQNAHRFASSKGTLKGWISCLAYHRALKRWLLLKKKDRESGDADKAAHTLEANVRPEQWIRSLDFRRCLGTVLATLQEKQRRTLLLYFFEGQELSVIAKELGESLGNTRHYLYRGLAKLRRELVQNGLLQGYIEFDGAANEDEVPR